MSSVEVIYLCHRIAVGSFVARRVFFCEKCWEFAFMFAFRIADFFD